jgi:hypothetical protein
VIVGLDSKPTLLWNGNSASGTGGRYGVVEVTQYMTADARRRKTVFVVWRQRDGTAFRRRISAADTLEAAKAAGLVGSRRAALGQAPCGVQMQCELHDAGVVAVAKSCGRDYSTGRFQLI